MHADNDADTVVSSSTEDIKSKHLSHMSADSVATTDFGDDDDDNHHRDLHRRSHSGSDSLYSVVTETTEPNAHTDKVSSPITSVTSTPSKNSTENLTIITTTPPASTGMLPIQRGEQLDPWGSNPYDQEDLATTLRFQRSKDDVDVNEFDAAEAAEMHDTVIGLASSSSSPTAARPVTSSLSTSSNSSLSFLGGNAGADAFARLDREFEMLTQGQAIQITTTAASSPLALDFDREQLDDPRGIMERSISDKDKKIKMSKLFSRASSNGDMNRVADMLDNFRNWIDLEAQDEDGTTPLIYAACFGHTEIAFMLLEAGALVDARDKFGWTALVWATNNKHENIVRLLLEQGASTSAQTAKGHTIVDFLRHDPNDNTKIVQIFQEPGRRDSVSSNGSLFRTNNSSLGDDFFYQSGIEGFEEIMAENERRYRMAMDSANAFDVDMADLSLADQVCI